MKRKNIIFLPMVIICLGLCGCGSDFGCKDLHCCFLMAFPEEYADSSIKCSVFDMNGNIFDYAPISGISTVDCWKGSDESEWYLYDYFSSCLFINRYIPYARDKHHSMFSFSCWGSIKTKINQKPVMEIYNGDEKYKCVFILDRELEDSESYSTESTFYINGTAVPVLMEYYFTQSM
jgi:hypothetical protein